MAGSFVALIVQLIRALTGGAVTGVAVSISGIYFLLGAMFVCVGVLGSYVGRIYEETKNRPLYIVDEFYQKGGGPQA
jgi:hypothetical protein